MSGTFTLEQAGDEAVDVRGAGADPAGAVTATQEDADGLDRSFVVTIKTPAGHEHRFRVSGEQRVETVTRWAVAYFVKHGELAEGKYVLAVMRNGTPEDMTASARLEDYGIREGDVLVLIVGEAPAGRLMLHPVVLADLLDDEVAAAVERLENRAADLVHDGRHVRCPLRLAGDSRRWLSLDGLRYDGEPFRVAVCGPDGAPLPIDGWPPGLAHSVHPVTGEPFACVRGTWEYYQHPSHHQERWDAHRPRLRLADLLDHLLRKASQ